MPDLTVSVSAPRVAGIEFPLGQNLGQPGDAAGQTAVLRATLRALVDIDTPGAVVNLPFTWPESAEEVRSRRHDPPPISKAIMRRPWLYRNLLNGDIPAEYRSGRDPIKK